MMIRNIILQNFKPKMAAISDIIVREWQRITIKTIRRWKWFGKELE